MTASLEFLIFRGALILMSAACLAGLLIFINIAYQPWMSRFLGCIYLPIYIAASIVIGFYAACMPGFGGWRAKYQDIALVLVPIVAAINFANSINLTDNQLPFPGILRSRNEDKTSSYRHWLLSNKRLSPSKVEELIAKVGTSNFESMVLCHEEDSWCLIPMMLAVSNSSYREGSVSSRALASGPRPDDEQTSGGSKITYTYLP